VHGAHLRKRLYAHQLHGLVWQVYCGAQVLILLVCGVRRHQSIQFHYAAVAASARLLLGHHQGCQGEEGRRVSSLDQPHVAFYNKFKY